MIRVVEADISRVVIGAIWLIKELTLFGKLFLHVTVNKLNTFILLIKPCFHVDCSKKAAKK